MSELLCWLGFHELKYINQSHTMAYCFRSKRCRGKLHRIVTHNHRRTE